MERAERPRGGATIWVTRALVLIVALLAVWLSLRNMLHELLEREYPALAVAIRPSSPVAESGIALNRVVADGGVVDDQSRAYLRSALRHAPLLAEPFIVAGLDASAAGRPERARTLFEEARHRDPRLVIGRYWLFDYYLRAGDYAQGIAEAAPIVRLQPAAASPVATILTALLDVPRARPALVAALERNPPWRDDFFRQVAATPRLRNEAAALLRQRGGSSAGADDQQAVIRSLVGEHAYGRARDLWIALLPGQYRSRASGVYDGDFAGWPGSAPFNWRLFGERKGLVERIAVPTLPQRTGLAIHAQGDAAEPLAEQLVIPAPGNYRLSAVARTLEDESSTETGLQAMVRCAATAKPLAQTVLDRVSDAATPLTLDFTLPASCGAAMIQFGVKPGITPGPLGAVLTGVRLSRR